MTSIKMQDITSKYMNGEYNVDIPFPKTKRYPENHIFDDEKSVRWNREKVIELNEKNKAEQRAYKDKVNEMENKFVVDFVDAMVDDLSIKTEQAVIVYKFMRREMDIPASDMASYADDIVNMIAEFNNFS